jgi:hypothetical protein
MGAARKAGEIPSAASHGGTYDDEAVGWKSWSGECVGDKTTALTLE